MRALAFIAALVACVPTGDDVTRSDEDAESCCWLWPAHEAIVECVRERIEPGCVVVECALVGWEREVCTEETTQEN